MKNAYIEIMGCQMNKLDGELIMQQLAGGGYAFVDTADAADVVIYVTCSVRQHAEEKVLSKLGMWRNRPGRRPLVAVVGCMAQRLGHALARPTGCADVVCGPAHIYALMEMLDQAQKENRPVVRLNENACEEKLDDMDLRHGIDRSASPVTDYVRIMRGCNNYCSYCIVPYVRGREVSRPLEHIVTEVKQLAERGVREIILLGQAVNFYRYEQNGRTLQLADVLEAIHDTPGLERIRFVTSYPRDIDNRLLQTMARLPKVCEYLHLCAQSGSDRILRAMNRHYTVAEYLDIIARARAFMPDMALAGDFIVGFCGETEDDFAATKDLLKIVKYKNCYMFKYSPRPGTRAATTMTDDVPEEIKKRRLAELLQLQNQISQEHHRQFIGQNVEVLVEGLSKKPHLDGPKSGFQLTGRTRGDHIVVFPGSPELIGQRVTCTIDRASAITLFGKMYSPHS